MNLKNQLDHIRFVRIVLLRLDEKGEAMKARIYRIGLHIGVVLITTAHLHKPNIEFCIKGILREIKGI